MSAPNAEFNAIELAKSWVPILDEVYKNASVTSDLTSAPELARAGINANEIVYPQVEVDGLGDYDRNKGYTDTSVSVIWKTTTFNYDRGSRISVDAMDNLETYNIAFGKGASELMRTKVAPEADAFTFATLFGIPGVNIFTGQTITDALQFRNALLTCKNQMDNDEVPEDSRILYARPSLLNSLLLMDDFQSKEIVKAFNLMRPVPPKRFFSAIDMLDGRTAGEEAGHYKPSEGALPLNFVVVEKSALIKFDKHIFNGVIPAAQNVAADADIHKYRKYGIVDVYENKTDGIYISAASAVA